MKTAGKDYFIFKKQAILIIRRIKLASNTNQFYAQNNVNMKWVQNNLLNIYQLVNHKCQHLYQIEIHFNIHQHA